MFIWVCLLGPVGIPTVIGHPKWIWPWLGSAKDWKHAQPLTLGPRLFIRTSFKCQHPFFKKNYEDVWAHPLYSWLWESTFLEHLLSPAWGWGGTGVDSVNSRDIKLAVSGLHHLPGFFLCFLCSPFFPLKLLGYNKLCNHRIWYHFITVQRTLSYSFHPPLTLRSWNLLSWFLM